MTTHDEQWTKVCEPRLDMIAKDVKEIRDIVVGDNGDGIKGRLITLEQRQDSLRGTLKGIWTAIVALAAAAAASVFA